jgi:hypothetical protein
MTKMPAGAAPVEIASADKSRRRLARHGDRQLNSALHTIAMTRIRMTSSSGHRYYETELAEGKTPREAARCFKRRLADHIWRVMITTNGARQAREDTWGRLCKSSVADQPRQPALRTSHFPDPPLTNL